MRRIISLIISAAVLIALLVCFFTVGRADIPAFGRDYALVRVFDRDGMTLTEISDLRYAAEAASTADVEQDGRLWCDAYSYFTEVRVSRPDSNGVDCNAVVTGGDFFLFHDLDFKSGWYYTDTDLHLDRVVIDEKLAFELFGSNDVEDMRLTLGGKTLYVAGVVALDDSRAKEMQMGDKPMIYLPQYIAEGLFGERAFEHYEIMLQDPVKGHAVNSLATVTEGKEVVDVTNRYGIGRIFGILKEFPTRSYRSESVTYPYWENADRGTEDVLTLILSVGAVTALVFVIQIIIFIIGIIERKKR